MPEKKAPPKRPNGSAKPEKLKTKASKTQTRALSDEEIATKAYLLWEHRGRPLGSPEEDWFRARQELRQAQGKSNS